MSLSGNDLNTSLTWTEEHRLISVELAEDWMIANTRLVFTGAARAWRRDRRAMSASTIARGRKRPDGNRGSLSVRCRSAAGLRAAVDHSAKPRSASPARRSFEPIMGTA